VESSLKIREMLFELKNKGKTILLSTHDMNLVEKVADRVLIINKGKIIVCDRKENLLNAFRKKAYKIVFEGENGKIDLRKYGKFYEEYGEKILEIQLDDISQLYEIMEIFKKEHIEIRHLENVMVNFEEVFVNIVRGDEN